MYLYMITFYFLKTVGTHGIEVFYKLRKEANSADEVTGNAESLATLQVVCIIPKLKVKDIKCNELGNLYSKVSLWDILNIDT